MKTIALLFTLLILICPTETFAQKKKWSEVQETHTIEAYIGFVEKYPKSDFKEEALKQIEILEWTETKKTNTKESYTSFIKKYPKSEFREQLQNQMKILVNKEWEHAKNENSIEAYMNFLKNNPGSEYVKEATEVLHEMEWKKTKNGNESYRYKSYIKKYPNSPYKEEAQEILKSHTYKTTSFRPNGKTTVQGNEKGYMKMTVSKAFTIGNDKREIAEILIGTPATEETTEDGLIRCIYPGISFWTNNEQDYWQDQGNYDKIWEQNTPRTLILYYDTDQKIANIEVVE